ncbi:uncharacterized protein LOC111287219 [Durio zibethinus]|uniref:Uncharacterized protein LOC111287219 n=1 Tax=Durio zibethinus TaxID=66656 RepID=A0A6P5XYQ3_DURZI|nr:uncharacterized protein LOC111287219 [Durio zibethinus]
MKVFKKNCPLFSFKSSHLCRDLSFSPLLFFFLFPITKKMEKLIQEQKKNQTQDTELMEEKRQEQKQSQTQEAKQKMQKTQEGRHLVWDCGSSLYDSFELNSLKRQLDSAIHSRTMSMPHLVDARAPPPPPPQSTLPPSVSKKQPSKFSRSIYKLFKSMFKFKQSSSSSVLWLKQRSHEEYYVVYDKTGALTTIPEAPEIDYGRLSPEINSLAVKRTASERFTTASTIGFYCA